MFDFMKRYQAPILWFCVISLGGLGAWATLSDSMRGSSGPTGDMGTFKLPSGEAVTVSVEGYYTAAQELDRNLRSKQQVANQIQVQYEDDPQVVWSYLVLKSLAKEAGVIATDGAIVASINEARAAQPGADPVDVNLYKRSPETVRELYRDLTAIRTFRTLSDRARPSATYEQVFERFKQDYESLRAKYAWFNISKDDVKVDPANAEDRTTLAKYLADDATIKAANRVPDRIDGQVMYVRTADMDDAALEKAWKDTYAALVAGAGLTVTDEQAKNRYNAFPESYAKFAEAAAKARQTTTDSKPADNPTEFDLVKERVKKEYLLAKLAEKAFAEWKGGGDGKAIADKYGFRLADVKNLDSIKIQQHPDFPSSNAALQVFQQIREGKLTPPAVLDAVFSDAYACKGAVEEPGSNVAVWKVTAFNAEREPTLDDEGVLTKVVDAWKAKKAGEMAQTKAEAFRKAVDDRVAEKLKSKLEDLEKGRVAAIENRIKEKNLSRDKASDGVAILEIENEEKKKQEEASEAAKASVEAEAFASVAKEQNVDVRDTGWLRRSNGGRDARFTADDKLDADEKAARFWRKTSRLNALAELKEGRIGMLQLETAWGASAVPLLEARRAATVDEMWAASKTNIDQIKQRVAPTTPGSAVFTWENLKNKAWVDLNAPDSDKDIEARKETARKEAERKADREKKQKAADDARAAKLVRDAMNDRPVGPGEGW